MTASARAGWQRLAVPLAMLVVLAAAVGLRAFDLGGACFDCDELYAVRVRGAGPEAVASVMVRDGFHSIHPPLMSVPYQFWNAAAGYSEGAVRLLPLLAGVAAVGLVFLLGRALGRPWAGVFAAAVLAVNPLHVAYSQEARQYSLLVALLCGAHLLFVLAWRRGTRGWLLAYYLTATWAAFTHYFAVPVLLGHAALAGWHAVRGPDRGVAWRLLLAVGFAGLPYLAWLPVVRAQTRMALSDYLAALSAERVAESVPSLLGVGGWGTGVGVALSGGVVFLALLGVWSARRVRPAAVGPTVRLAPGWVGPVVLLAGVLGGAGLAVAFPHVIEPRVRQVLAEYGYDAAAVDAEVGLLRQTGLLLAGCVAAAGAVLVLWRRVERTPPPPTAGGDPTAVFLLCGLVVPTLVVAAAGLSGMQFLQTRNLLPFLPAVAVAVGFALDRLARTPAGVAVAVAVVLGLTMAAGQYDPVGRVVGLGGPRLGLDTIDWKAVRAELAGRSADGRVLVVVRHPATDPAEYYLTDPKPLRLPADAPADTRPQRVRYVHLTDNTPSQRLLNDLQAAGPLIRVAAGGGWELWESP